MFRAILQSFAKDASSACTTIQVRAIICELSVCTLKRCFAPLCVNTRANRGDKKFSTKMAKTKKTPQRKSRTDDGARPSTSKDTGEGPKKFERKGEHSQWISFLNEFNMQYIPIKIIMK